uniref:Ubiquitin conjugating enzyme E2 E2 n=1 Tax=Capra hircus TaxID=9925 RepID=A0A8C2Y0T4_CAPHI
MSTEAQRVDDSPGTSGGSSDGDQRESVQQEPEREQVQPKKKEGKISSKTAAKLSTSAKRIQKELAEITLDPPPNCRWPVGRSSSESILLSLIKTGGRVLGVIFSLPGSGGRLGGLAAPAAVLPAAVRTPAAAVCRTSRAAKWPRGRCSEKPSAQQARQEPCQPEQHHQIPRVWGRPPASSAKGSRASL